jgi:hypothetical protein
MRLLICLIPLLWGCSTPAVRCDAHLQRINSPVAGSTGGVTPEIAPARRAP